MMRYFTMLLFSILLFGCVSRPTGLITVNGEKQHVFFQENGLASRLMVTSAHRNVDHGLTQAVVELQNESSQQLKILYRFYWYDNEGLEVSQPSAWFQAVVKGLGSVRLHGTSPNEQGQQFRVLIREAGQ